jgi:TolB-like protein/tetratricopeptide (TPR) repeat protein
MRSQSAIVEPEYPALLDPEQIRVHVAQVTQSPEFARSPRLARFLSYVVENALAGRSDHIKESLIAVEVYGRSPDYNPQIDSTVRVEAGRLRARLRQYYEGAGASEPLRIELPKGSYVPVFQAQECSAISAEQNVSSDVAPDAPIPVPARRFTRFQWWSAVAVVTLLGIAAASFLWSARKDSKGVIDSVAVLPFVNLSGDSVTALFAEGLTEDVTTALGRESRVRVVSRTATSRYKQEPVDASRVGAELGVRAVLQGSVRRAGDRVTVTTRLIDAVSGYHLWADRYEREAANPSSTQNEFTRSILGALRDVLRVSSESSRAPVPVAGDTLALYQRATDLLRIPVLKNGQPDKMPESVLEALRLFREVTVRSPEFANGWVGLAEAAEWEYELRGNRPAERLAEAKSAAQRAVQIEPDNVEGWTVLSSILLYRAWDFKAAKAACRRAIELDPRNTAARRRYIDVLRLEGRAADAKVELERAIELQPSSAPLRLRRASLLFEDGRYDAALAEARAAGELTNQFPFYPTTLSVQGLCLEQMGRFAEAEKAFRSALALQPHDPWSEPALAHLLARNRRSREAEAMLSQIREHMTRGRVTHVAEAVVLKGLGRTDEALSALELGLRDRDDSLPFVGLDPRFRSLASEPRFRAVMAKVASVRN